MPIQEALLSTVSSVGRAVSGVQEIKDRELERTAKEARLLKTQATTEKQLAQAQVARDRAEKIRSATVEQKAIMQERLENIKKQKELADIKLQQAALKTETQEKLSAERLKQSELRTKALQDKVQGVKVQTQPEQKQVFNLRTRIKAKKGRR